MGSPVQSVCCDQRLELDRDDEMKRGGLKNSAGDSRRPRSGYGKKDMPEMERRGHSPGELQDVFPHEGSNRGAPYSFETDFNPTRYMEVIDLSKRFSILPSATSYSVQIPIRRTGYPF
jgi:hypothetical protein